MGSVLSRNPRSPLGICITLDAFGTLYHPKKPIAIQYLEVAQQCGLKADIHVPKLEASFRRAFRDQSAKYPNYGKSKGMTVESWWYDVVYSAFHPLCRGQTMPASLASTLFHHFSSRDAYALYPDVLPFFQIMQKLRQKYGDPKGAIVLVGVVTNSDNRALTILQSLGLRVGHEWEHESAYQSVKDIWHDGKQRNYEAPRQGHTLGGEPPSRTLLDTYNSEDDIDFLITSYASSSEKPDVRIFAKTDEFAATLRMSRMVRSSNGEFVTEHPFEASKFQIAGLGMTHIHVGDDYKKDYEGAKNTNRQALHLCRDKKVSDLKDYQISNLLELTTFISVMADVNLSPATTTDKETL